MRPDDFERLLSWLDPDREAAAAKYLHIRSRLIKILIRKGCWEPEDVVDETFDRVAQKVDDLKETYIGDPAAYFGGVARNVYLEWLRKKSTPPPVPDIVPPDEETGPEYDCLDDCLKHLAPKNRVLVLEYYQDDKQAKIDRRKALAEREGLEMEALRLRVHRIRKVLRVCVSECLERKVTPGQMQRPTQGDPLHGGEMDRG